ncbi:MAG: hypothetical protein JXR49_17580 [Acidobacteria bacterium]|nr:hypothetical protein [Acidobacteriota bacterium]
MIKEYPVIKRCPPEISPKFVEWVAEFGPVRLARALGIRRSTVHAWVTSTGRKRRPHMDLALDMVALSEVEPLHGKTPLTINDILGETRIVEIKVRNNR